jgi:hypothetical protein
VKLLVIATIAKLGENAQYRLGMRKTLVDACPSARGDNPTVTFVAPVLLGNAPKSNRASRSAWNAPFAILSIHSTRFAAAGAILRCRFPA